MEKITVKTPYETIHSQEGNPENFLPLFKEIKSALVDPNSIIVLQTKDGMVCIPHQLAIRSTFSFPTETIKLFMEEN